MDCFNFVNVTVNVTVNGTVNDIVKQKILECIELNPSMTMDEMVSKLGISRKNLARKIKELKIDGFVEREGSDKKGSWKVLK